MRAETILLGGGISATLPFTINTLQMAVSTTPPSISDSLAKQSANGRSIAFGSGALFGAANDQIMLGTGVTGGAGAAGEVHIGNNITGGAVAAGFDPNVVFGGPVALGGNSGNIIVNTGLGTITLAGGTSNVVALCAGGLVGGDPGNQSVLIGGGMTLTVGTSRNVLIGAQISVSVASGNDNTFVGAQTSGVGCSQVTVVGSNSGTGPSISAGFVGIGYNVTTQTAAPNAIAIGRNIAVRAANNILIGAGLSDATIPTNTAVLGGPSTPILNVIFGRGNTSAVAVGAGLLLRCTDGSGVDIDVGPLTILAPRSTGNVATGKIIFQTGAPGASGAALQAATTQFEVLPSAGGGGIAGVNFANVTNGAAALAGTLLNSPVAGNPTFWMPVQVNGVVRFIPTW